MKVAVVTCYKDPDYIRARSIRASVDSLANVQVQVIKNKRIGVGRYLEVAYKVLKSRFTTRPAIYILTFRGYEILPFMAILTWPKPLIYDEFINPIEWLNEPREEKWASRVPTGLLKSFYTLLLRRCRYILTDTQAHLTYSSKLLNISKHRFVYVPVSTDETVFKPMPHLKKPDSNFKIFYYGNMLPLHGLKYVLDAALLLKYNKTITFLLVGGKQRAEESVLSAISKGARVVYLPWIPFHELPKTIAASDLCLAGPFGNTVQANNVITGKAYQFLAMGVPVLIGRSKASNEFLRDGDNCLAVPQADSKALADKITWAFHNNKQLSAIGLKGRCSYETLFSNKVVAQKFKEMFSSLSLP